MPTGSESIPSSQHNVVNPSSFDGSTKEPELSFPASSQTSIGDDTQRDLPPIIKRDIEQTSTIPNINPDATKIVSLKNLYKSQLSKKAKLEQKQKLAQSVQPIRQAIAQPETTSDFGYMVYFKPSDGGDPIRVVPPQPGIDKDYLQKLHSKLEVKLQDIENMFGVDGEKLEESLKQVEREKSTTYQALILLGVSELELNAYKPVTPHRYKVTCEDVASDEWALMGNTDTDSFVLEPVPQHVHEPKPQPSRAILSTVPAAEYIEPEYHKSAFGLEYPVDNIIPIASVVDNPPELFPPGIDDQTISKDTSMPQASLTARASVITGGPNLKLPVEQSAALDLFKNPEIFKVLHKQLQDSLPEPGDYQFAAVDQLSEMGPENPIRQCFCYRGSTGTAFVHVLSNHFDKKPGKNNNNQFMVLWYPDDDAGQHESAETAKNTGHDIVTAIHKYNEHADYYNRLQFDEELKAWKKQGSANNSPKPVKLPEVQTIRLCYFPYEASQSESVNLDNETMSGICDALNKAQGSETHYSSMRRLIKTLEVPAKVVPESLNFTEESAQRILDTNMKNAQLQQPIHMKHMDDESPAQPVNSTDVNSVGLEAKDEEGKELFYRIKDIQFHLEGPRAKELDQEKLQKVAKNIDDLIRKKSSSTDSPLHDSDMLNIIYITFQQHFKSFPCDLDVNICLNVDDNIWVVNRGKTHMLCCPRGGSEARNLSADNTAKAVVECLKEAIPSLSKIKPENLPAVTKLSVEQDDQFYLIQSGAGFRQVIPDEEVFGIVAEQIKTSTGKGYQTLVTCPFNEANKLEHVTCLLNEANKLDHKINERLKTHSQEKGNTNIPCPNMNLIFMIV